MPSMAVTVAETMAARTIVVVRIVVRVIEATWSRLGLMHTRGRPCGVFGHAAVGVHRAQLRHGATRRRQHEDQEQLLGFSEVLSYS